MNGQSELMLLRELLWNRSMELGNVEQNLAILKSILSQLVFSISLPSFVFFAIIVGVILFYQPRTPRGALWVPAFGIFGGSPKLYMHSRPPSLFGLLLKSRRRFFGFRIRK